jgi:hypothetical protein
MKAYDFVRKINEGITDRIIDRLADYTLSDSDASWPLLEYRMLYEDKDESIRLPGPVLYWSWTTDDSDLLKTVKKNIDLLVDELHNLKKVIEDVFPYEDET